MNEVDLPEGVKEELGEASSSSSKSYKIEGGKECLYDDCDWETPRDMVQNFHKSRGEALLTHLKEEHNGKFPFEADNS